MKGFADYMCEEIRRSSRRIEREIEEKERRELQEFIDRTRREIAETEEWLRQEEEVEAAARRIEPSAMFYLLKGFGGIAAFERFDFRSELEETATALRLSVAQTAAYILVAGLQRRCPCGVAGAHIARYTDADRESSVWDGTLAELKRLGLLSIAKRTDKGTTYYKINMQ